MTLNDLLSDTLARVEENEEGGPIFWQQTPEILPALVDGMFEAALITGTVQAVEIPVTLAANTTFFPLQNATSIGIPAGVICALRMRAPYPIRKATLKGLSDMTPGWQTADPAQQLIAWFPLGVSAFGIYPQYSVESQVVMDFIVAPTTAARPYTPAISVPFQEEFVSAFPEYAATYLRCKELGIETETAETVYNEFLQQMKNLSMFQGRLDSLVMTNTMGARATVSRREMV